MLAMMSRMTKMAGEFNSTALNQAKLAKGEAREQMAAITQSVDSTIAETESEMASVAGVISADEASVTQIQRSTHASIEKILRAVQLTNRAMNGSAIRNVTVQDHLSAETHLS